MGREQVRGVTLLELLVGLVIVSLVAGVGVPVMSTWVRQQGISASRMELMRMLDAGRYLALAENDFVTLCPYDEPGGACRGDWGRTAKMFIDINGNGQQDPADRLLHGNFLLPEGTWLEWRSFRRLPYLQWAPFGRTNSLNGTFTLCNREGRAEWVRQWVVSKGGRVREINPARMGGIALQNALRVCA